MRKAIYSILCVLSLAIPGAVQEATQRPVVLAAISPEVSAEITAKASEMYGLEILAAAADQYMAGVSDPILEYCSELSELTPTGGTITVHSAPIRYRDNKGKLRPIVTALERANEDGQTVLRNVTNDVAVRFYPNGGVSLNKRGKWLAYKPINIGFDGSRLTLAQDRDNKAARIDAVQRRAHAVKIGGVLPFGVELDHEVVPGGVKETAILPEGFAVHIPAKATAMVIRYRYEVPEGMRVAMVGGSLVCLDSGSDEVYRFDPSPVTDAAGNRTLTSFDVRDQTFDVRVSADFLRTATYPVLVDPTTSTQSFPAYAYTTQSGEHGADFLKVNLPSINGDVTACTLELTKVNAAGDPGDGITLAAYTTADVSWTEASNATTLNGLTVASTGGSDTLNNDDASGTVYSWDVLGNDTVGNTIHYAYDNTSAGVCNPGQFTIKLYAAVKTSATGAAGADVEHQKNSGDEVIETGGTNNVTTSVRPKLNITYTGELGCGGSSAGVGVGPILIF